METTTLISAIDFDLLLKRLNNDESFLREILKDFILDVQTKLVKLKMYLLQENFDEIQIIAHTLKGTTSYLTAHFMNEAVCKLEKVAKRKDSKMVFTYFKIFESEFTKLIQLLSINYKSFIHEEQEWPGTN